MRRLLAAFLSLAIAGAPESLRGRAIYFALCDGGGFRQSAMKLREQAMIKVEPQVLIPTSSRPAIQRYPWKMNIVTTVFWVGEEAGGNNPVPNYKSCLGS